METRANYLIVGLFTLAVVAGAVGFVYWFAAGRGNGDKASYRVIFTGSVSGLVRGSIVRFNGLRVGEVTALDFMPEDPSRVVALIDVDTRTPVKTDTRARLEFQGLTGQASIQLTGGTAGAPALTVPDGSRPTIFADRSDFQDLLETAQRIAGRADQVLNRVDRLVGDNEAVIGATLRSVEVFARALADNAGAVGGFLDNAGQVASRFSGLSLRLETLSQAAEELIRSVDAASVNRTIGNVETVTAALAGNRSNIDTILGEGAQLAQRLADTQRRLDATLTEAQRLFVSLDREGINRTIGNVDRFTAALGESAPQARQAIQDAADITSRLRTAADRLDGVLAAAQRFLGANEGAGQGAFGEIAETARAFRTLAGTIEGRLGAFTETASAISELARNLDRRTAQLTAGVNRLVNSGNRDLEALASETRRAVNEVNRAVRSLARDPAQVITGGRPPIPEFRGER